MNHEFEARPYLEFVKHIQKETLFHVMQEGRPIGFTVVLVNSMSPTQPTFAPVSTEALPHPPEARAQSLALEGGGTILVVDDDPIIGRQPKLPPWRQNY